MIGVREAGEHGEAAAEFERVRCDVAKSPE